MAEICARIRAPQPSLALPEDTLKKEYKKFVRIDNKAVDEQLVIKNILPILEGGQQQQHHAHHDRTQTQAPASCGTNYVFKKLAPLTDGTLPNAKPSFYHGARANQLHPRIREQLSDMIIPTKRSNRPIAPNFFVEAKGSDGSLAVLGGQALYAGALGARGCIPYSSMGMGMELNNKIATATIEQELITITTTITKPIL